MDASTYCKIESLSAQAIDLMANGSFAEASKGMSFVLRQLLPYVMDPSQDDAEDSNDADGMELGNLLMQCVPVLQPNVSTATLHSEERIFPLFACAILYTPCSPDQPWKLKDYRKAAASTVYNMALANHLQGLLEVCNHAARDYHLHKALKAYKASRDVLAAVTYDDLVHSTEDVKYMLLAISNNEGHIYEQLLHLEEATNCLYQLHSILPCTAQTEEFAPFLVTAILFPRPDRLLLHAPVA